MYILNTFIVYLEYAFRQRDSRKCSENQKGNFRWIAANLSFLK